MHRLLPPLLLTAACGTPSTDTGADTDVTPLALKVEGLLPYDGPLADDCDLALPEAHECDGPNPGVTWSGGPEAAGYVLVFDDPDAGDFPHWAVWELAADATGIPEGSSGNGLTSMLPGDARELENGFGWVGYLGSCPPSAHVYRWTLWAVDDSFEFTAPSGTAQQTFDALRDAARAASLEKVRACHVYGPAVSP